MPATDTFSSRSAPRSALLVCLLFIGTVEIILRLIDPYSLDNDPVTPGFRNPLVHRAWPEHVSRPQLENGIVVLGNSQAVGLEIPDPESTYVGKVANALRADSSSQPVANWSVTGLKQGQLEILTLKAIERGVNHLVYIVSLNNFSPVHDRSIARDPSDIPLLIGDGSLFPGVFRSRVVQTADLDSILERVVRRFSAVARSRTLFLDRVAERLPRNQQRLFFGHRRAVNAMQPISERKTADVAPQIRPMQITMPVEHWIPRFREKQLAEAMAFYTSTREAVTDKHTRITWIWMPFSRRDDTTNIVDAMAVVHGEFCEQLVADGTTCIDLSDALDASLFLSPDLSSHLSSRGHDEMARLVLPIVSDAIH